MRWLWPKSRVVPVDTFPGNYPVETPSRDYPWGRWPWSNTRVVPLNTPPVDTPPVDTMGKDVMFGKPDNPINNVARPSWEFAWPYKDMNKDSYIIHFSFNLIKKDTKDHLIF